MDAGAQEKDIDDAGEQCGADEGEGDAQGELGEDAKPKAGLAIADAREDAVNAGVVFRGAIGEGVHGDI